MPVSKTRTPAKKATPRAAKADRTSQGYTLGSKSREMLVDLTLPSGETCEARRPGVQGFIRAGIIDSFDELTSLVQTEHVQQKSSRPQKVTKEQALAAGQAMMVDKAKLEAGFELIDRLAAHTITQPEVWIDYQLTNESDEDWEARQARELHRVPITVVGLDDKVFLMQWAVGGAADLKAFRKEFGTGLVDLAAIEGVSLPAK